MSVSVPRSTGRPGNFGSLLVRELRLARLEIREGRFQRSMAVMAAFSAIVSGFEAYIQHLRGAFRHWLMWTPVLLAVPVVLVSGVALFRERAARTLLPAISVVSLLDGITGFVFHLRGIKRMPGGFKVGQYNVVMGPPVFAPLLMCTIGIMGILAGFLRRERLHLPQSQAMLASEAVRRAVVRPQADRLAGCIARLTTDIRHGRFQGIMAASSAFFAILAGGEAYFEHLRGSFNQRIMWTPILVTIPMVVTTIGAMASATVARVVLPVTSIITFVGGALGFFLHLRGVRRMPGGFDNFHFNITLGPPLFAPLLFSAVGLLGMIAALLRREEGR